jgi:hypothetical protein
MKTQQQPEIVEVIDDASTVSGFTATRPTDDSGGRRWLGAAAGLALLVLIGYGVATSASSNAIPTVAAPTTTATRHPPPARNRALAYVKPEFYVLDRSLDGYTMQSAESIAPDGSATSLAPTRPAELWATAGAAATSGSWFVVSEGTRHVTGRNSYRTVVGDVEMVIEHDSASGQTRLAFVKDNRDLEITSFGWADRQLTRLAMSVSVDENSIRYVDSFFKTDHTLVVNPGCSVGGWRVSVVDAVGPWAGCAWSVVCGGALGQGVRLWFGVSGSVMWVCGCR